MKTFGKLFCASLLFMAGTLTSCTDYQDEIDALDGRVTILENLVDRANSNISAMQTLVNAVADGWVITGMVEVDADHDPQGRGYRTITFGKLVWSEELNDYVLSDKSEDKKVTTIYNGLNGRDGADAAAPDISLRLDPDDGNYYWIIDGVWLTNSEGQRIQANGNDGKDGKDGVDGKDGEDGKDGVSTAPLLGINSSGQWIVSFDNGETWELLLDSTGNAVSATGEKGKDGRDGKDGQDGQDGQDGEDGKDGQDGDDAFQFIKSVTISLDAEGNRFVIFILYDDTTVKLPLK